MASRTVVRGETAGPTCHATGAMMSVKAHTATRRPLKTDRKGYQSLGSAPRRVPAARI
jgi:hypothetical protein